MPTRISGACNGCRSKKQKCSGDKSGCAQCEAAGITCTWPEQRKRGPAKGYIEGLEHRLHEAESLLLQVLPHITAEQLQAATLSLANNDVEETSRTSPDRRGSPPVLNKKTGIDYWENFPLNSVDSIRRWQQDCEINSVNNNSSSTTAITRSSTIKSEARNASPHSLSGDAQPSRRKRLSISDQQQQPRSMITYSNSGSGTAEANPMDDLVYSMHNSNDQDQAQVLQNSELHHHQMSLDRQRQNSWQASMMNVNVNPGLPPQQQQQQPQQQHPHRGMPQQQLFSHVGYMNSSNASPWPVQAAMDINMSNEHHHSQQDSMPAVSSQTHSHLFW